MAKFNVGWYVIYTKPRHEKKVAEELQAADIHFYMPMHKSLRTWHDRRKYIDVPLFQSYIFVRLNNLQEYYEGLKIDGVICYVRFGNEIARVSDKIISDIQMLVSSGSEIEMTADYFQPGQQVFISHGPFTGLSCEVVEREKKKKILVRLNLMQRNILVALPSDSLITV